MTIRTEVRLEEKIYKEMIKKVNRIKKVKKYSINKYINEAVNNYNE